MDEKFSFSKFHKSFSQDDICLEKIKNIRYPRGLFCTTCKKRTRHYRIASRMAYTCKICRNQIYPLKGTIFEKTTTPLSVWFYCLFLMTQSRGKISIKQIQRELGVTYKTAWRMYQKTHLLMEQNNADLLTEVEEKVRKWIFFNKIQLTVVEKQDAS
jgi:transposase